MDSTHPVPLSVTISVKQTYSTQPHRPITISTSQTPISSSSIVDDYYLDSFVRVQYHGNKSYSEDHSIDNNTSNKPEGSNTRVIRGAKTTSKKKRPLSSGTFPGTAQRVHRKGPEHQKDLRKEMDFITVPSFESGEDIEFTNGIDIPRIIERWTGMAQSPTAKDEQGGSSFSESDVPIPGDIYDVYFTGGCSIDWWNWGDLHDHGEENVNSTSFDPNDIRSKQFVLLDHPDNDEELARIRSLLDKHKDWLPSFGCWDMEDEDDDGNEMVYLDVEIDKGCENELNDDGKMEDSAGDRAVKSYRWKAANARRNCVYGDISSKSRFSLSFE